MKNTGLLDSQNFSSIMHVSDVQKIFENVTGQQDVNIAIHKLMKDYILAKVFSTESAKYTV